MCARASLSGRYYEASALQRKDGELQSMSSKLEDEQSLVNKIQRQLKETGARVAELEDELENERQSRSVRERREREGSLAAAQPCTSMRARFFDFRRPIVRVKRRNASSRYVLCRDEC